MKANIVVLNYNGERLIHECLPSIIEAKVSSKYDVKITVIDNESTDNSINLLASYGSDINVVRMKNRVFCSYNGAVQLQREDIVILLNNDIRVDKNFIDPMVKVFENDEEAFMIAPKCYDFLGKTLEGGRSKGFIKYGWFGAMAQYPRWEREVDCFGYTFQSGFGAVRRDRFLELGGYDDLYLPGRLEDSDICFRAWKRGWKSYYEPKSIVYHIGGASFKKQFGSKGISAIDARNSALFFWKNIESPSYWLSHIVFLPLRILRWFLRGDIAAIKGFFQAFSKLESVAHKSRKEKESEYVLSDKEVFDIFK